LKVNQGESDGRSRRTSLISSGLARRNASVLSSPTVSIGALEGPK